MVYLLSHIIISVAKAFRMLCGCDQINFCRQLYTQNDPVTFEAALSSIQTQQGQTLTQNIYFDSLSNPFFEPPPTGTSFSASYNKALRQVVLETHNKQLSFWYGIHDEISIIKGDIIRAGKMDLYVHDIFPIGEFAVKKPQENLLVLSQKDKACRLCFSQEETFENPLLSLCACSGTAQFMHLYCYREWYHTKVQFFNSHKITYFQLKNVCCQICKTKIPFSVIHNNREYTLLDYKKQFKKERLYSEQIPVGHLPDFHDSSSSEQPNSLIDNSLDGNQENQIIENTQKKEEYKGLYILLRAEKLNENNEDIVEAILVKLGPNYMVTFGNQFGTSNIIIRNGQTCKLHMSLNYVNDRVFLSNFSEGLGTFLKMRENVEYEFIGTDGIIIDQQNKQLLHFREKSWFLACLQPQKKFRISFTKKPDPQ